MAPVFCIICALRVFVFHDHIHRTLVDETVEDHMSRLHPDPVVTACERRELELAMLRMLGIRRTHMTHNPYRP